MPSGSCTPTHLRQDGLAWTGTVVQEFWRGQDGLHINVKELQAAINTVRSLGKPKELVHLSVENSLSFAYLSKGGGRLHPTLQFSFSDAAVFQVVNRTTSSPQSQSGKIGGLASRFAVQAIERPRGLQHVQKSFLSVARRFPPFYSSGG